MVPLAEKYHLRVAVSWEEEWYPTVIYLQCGYYFKTVLIKPFKFPTFPLQRLLRPFIRLLRVFYCSSYWEVEKPQATQDQCAATYINLFLIMRRSDLRFHNEVGIPTKVTSHHHCIAMHNRNLIKVIGSNCYYRVSFTRPFFQYCGKNICLF